MKPLLEPYSSNEIETPKNINLVKHRMVDLEWEFYDSNEALEYKLNVPKAKVTASMNHRGQYEVKLSACDGRIICKAYNEDSTRLDLMRSEVYKAYRKFVSTTS